MQVYYNHSQNAVELNVKEILVFEYQYVYENHNQEYESV
jgi:hypothetical protein